LLTNFHMDIAASIQKVTEEVMLRLSRSLAREHGLANLCLAGGVALNCVANGKILRDGAFKNIWVQPARATPAARLGGAGGLAPVPRPPRSRRQSDSMEARSSARLCATDVEHRLGRPVQNSPSNGRRDREDGARSPAAGGRLDAGPHKFGRCAEAARSSATRARRPCRRRSICG
jgi:hypothetical protein